ncbi:MAG: O-antigen ligase family protein, partial [Elusimicrobia bacterium]|nr:O-antigen ligase family protein [Elusimicrobiota bacterium]
MTNLVPALLWVLCLLLGGGRPFWAWGVFSLAIIAAGFICKKVSVNFWLGLFFAWLFISVAGASEPLNSLWTLGHFSAGLLFAFLVSAGGKDLFLKVIIISGYGLAMIVLGAKILGIAAENFILPPNPNYSACIIAVGLAGAAVMFTDENYAFKNKIKLAVFTIAPILALFAIKSRGAFLAVISALVFLFISQKKFKALFILAVVCLVTIVSTPEKYLGMFFKTDDPMSYQRINIWKTALKVTAQNPLMGTGLGSF